jgi:hypothetical protein
VLTVLAVVSVAVAGSQSAAPARPAPPPPASAARVHDLQLAKIDRDHLLVRFRSRPADLAARLARAGAKVRRESPRSGWTTLATDGDAPAVKARLEREPAVAEVELSYVRRVSTVPNDPLWASDQRAYLGPLRMTRAWDLGKGSGVVVAVVDTGVDLGHRDLAGRFASSGINTVTGGDAQDDNGHGTMVAGVIAANNNTRGIAGIAPAAKIFPVKVLDAYGYGTDADIIAGIEAIAALPSTQRPRVMNMSFSGTEDSDALCAAVDGAQGAGIVAVAAAGNTGSETTEYPAACPGVIAVSATGDDGALTSFSTYGWQIDVAAPGLDITSTTLGSDPSSDSYETASGTSFSSPIVAGVAALVRGREPNLSRSQVVERLRRTARDVGPPGVDRAFGFGIVDPIAAMGGPPNAPRPVLSGGPGEPNDTPADAVALSLAARRTALIHPETDEDWYRVSLGTGWYSVQVPAGAGELDHDVVPVVQLFDAGHNLLASNELAGGDLVFKIASAGNYFVRVANWNGSTDAYEITVAPAAPPPLYPQALALLVGARAHSVAIRDLDGDGRDDLAFLMGDTSEFYDTLVVLAQTRDRSFRLADVIDTGFGTPGGGMGTGDVTGDGRADVAFPVSSGVKIIPQGADGLDPDGAFVVGGSGVKQVAITDFDGDTSPDLVTAGSAGVRVHWGPSFLSSTSAGSQSFTSLAVGDVTRDGVKDLVTTRSGAVDVWKGTGGRGLALAATTSLPSVAAVALDSASGNIAASVRANPGAVQMLRESGGSIVSVQKLATALAKADPVAVVDADGAGNGVMTMHDDAGYVGLMTASGNPDAPLNSEQLFFADDMPSASYDPRALAVGDLDGDGLADAAVATRTGVSVLLHRMDALPANYGTHLVGDMSPAPLATDVPANVTPVLTLTRPATNAVGAVTLVDARGDAVPAGVFGDGTSTITIVPVAPLAAGAYTVRAAGLRDASGNELDGFGSPFIVGPPPDLTAPSLKFVSPPSGTLTVAPKTVAFTSNDPAARFLCSLDNAPYRSCTSPVSVSTADGAHTLRVIARDPAGNERGASASWTNRPRPNGYWMLGTGGTVYRFGEVPALGNANTNSAIDLVASPSGYGYWVADSAGRVFAFGDAKWYGNASGLGFGESVTSISRTATGKGYWLFTSRGRVFAFGDARSYGDLRGLALQGPIVDSVGTPSGRGYYMVGSDGGVFAFGDARFYGSTGGMRLDAPVRSLVPDPDRVGYWLVAIDGGVFAFGAPFRGSMGGRPLNKPIVGMVAFGNGYLMVGADGGIFNFSNLPFYGSLGANPPPIPIVSVAASG